MDRYEVQRGDDDGGWERCAPMAQMNKVMNASIYLMEDMNTEMVGLLSYMNQAISDLADDIVATECSIMNFSWQIGVMADQVVLTEQMMAEAADECCLDESVKKTTPSLRKQLRRLGNKKPSLGDFTPPEECEPYVNEATSKKAVTSEANQQDILDHFETIQKKAASYVEEFALVHAKPSLQSVSDMMPCEHWYNPPCCAMEMCADMVIMMMDGMEEMAKAMADSMKVMIDLTLEMSQDILDTEGYIQDMGMEISTMSDYIVETEQMILDFMTDFCDHTPLRTSSIIPPSVTPEQRINHREVVQRMIETASKLQGEQREAFLHRQLSRLLKAHTLLSDKRESMGAVFKRIQSASFPENVNQQVGSTWQDMLDLMTQCFDTFFAFMDDQAGVMAKMTEEVSNLAGYIKTTEGYILDMADNINDMAGHIVETEEMMFELTEDCMYGN
jgi:hypothetical protein